MSSLLEQTGQDKLGKWLGISLLLHVVLFAGLILAGNLDLRPNAEPMFAPDDVIEVGLVSLPKSDHLPTRATRAPKAAPPKPAEPVPEAKPTPETPPAPNVMPEPEAPPQPEVEQPEPVEPTTPPDNSALMNDLLNDLTVPEGAQDRDATSPDGDPDVTAGSSLGGSPDGDPAYAAYIKQLEALFHKEFQPLPALRGQGLSTRVYITVASDGTVKSVKVSDSSGNPSWDRAAEVAAERIKKVPLPAEHLVERLSAGIAIRFDDN